MASKFNAEKFGADAHKKMKTSFAKGGASNKLLKGGAIAAGLHIVAEAGYEAYLTNVGSTTSTKFGTPSFLSYPQDVDKDHYVCFYINEHEKASVRYKENETFVEDTSARAISQNPIGRAAAANQPQKKRPLGSSNLSSGNISIDRVPTKRLSTAIMLYMPSSVDNNLSNVYNDKEFGYLARGQFAKATGAGIMNLSETAGAGISERMDVNLIQHGFFKSDRIETQYKNIDKRTFSYNFKFMPRSAEEVQTIKHIIGRFRFHSSPSRFEGDTAVREVLQIVPDTFDIEYKAHNGKENTFMNKVSTCVLTAVNVKYGNGDKTQFLSSDGNDFAPTTVELSLSFKELDTMSKERIAEGY